MANSGVLGHMIRSFAHDSAPLCAVAITDEEYPELVAHSMLKKALDAFTMKYPATAYNSFTKGSPQLQMPELKELLDKYQDPQQADPIAKIKKELEETKQELHKTIESVLERGEKINDLVAKSDGLSAQSKMFYTQVRPLCAEWMGRLLTVMSGQEAEFMLHRHVNLLLS